MRAQDLQNGNSDHAETVRRITALCDALGLSYSYNEKNFVIKLPFLKELPVANAGPRTRHSFDTSSWGPRGIDEEDLPDELPPTTTPLDEGQPPQGDDEV